ncbi:unnamed protein product [Acanthoscelides obtectus]|uniref:Uncharacterized protein n=1 Tax=Acanthoscelides obtectus TaxID=200917 RepID=A0A9P0L9H0_ACAOB|nr:unnamed protein product [Acanthoscelides obtectus]CAK1675973.1 hypothetical protein AOBTE_LOCUS30520 [Acanthoscelides obtectus]
MLIHPTGREKTKTKTIEENPDLRS